MLAQRIAAMIFDVLFRYLLCLVLGGFKAWPFGDAVCEPLASVISGDSIFQSMGASEVFSSSTMRFVNKYCQGQVFSRILFVQSLPGMEIVIRQELWNLWDIYGYGHSRSTCGSSSLVWEI